MCCHTQTPCGLKEGDIISSLTRFCFISINMLQLFQIIFLQMNTFAFVIRIIMDWTLFKRGGKINFV